MKQVHKNLKKGEIKLVIESPEDLWYLHQLIEAGDIIRGKTERKIQLGGEGKSRPVKKTIFLQIQVEKVLFEGESLRVSGIVQEGPEYVPTGSHHSFTLTPGITFTVIKETWHTYQLDRLKESLKGKLPPLLICVHDREEAYFALVKKQGFEILTSLKGAVEKKREGVTGQDFYKTITQQLQEYDNRFNLRKIIIASPAFFKEDLMKKITPDVKKKVILATCSSVGKNGIEEVLKRKETQSALQEDRVAQEMLLVEEILKRIQQEEAVAYGKDETAAAIEAGAVEDLLVTDKFIKQSHEDNTFKDLDQQMKSVDQSKGKIHIISSDHEGGKKLDGLGGMAALLRYKLSY